MFPFRYVHRGFDAQRRYGAPSVKTDIRPSRADQAPQGVELALEWSGGQDAVRMPRVEGHRLVGYDIGRSRE